MTLRYDKILITGGSRGIGLAIAQRLSREGAAVVITGRHPDELKQALDTLSPHRSFSIVQDVSDCAAMPSIVEQAAACMGGLNGLVNNAGIDPGNALEYGNGVFNLTPEIWDRVIAVNLRSVFFMMQAASRYMLDHNTAPEDAQPSFEGTFRTGTSQCRGGIVNISSEAAYASATGVYTVSKTGVKSLTAGWAELLGSRGIIVNGVAPGTTVTDMIDLPAELRQRRQKNGRLASPQDIANVVAWLFSHESANIMGQTILTCGGSTILP